MTELKILLAIWKTNLLSAMEYRAAFLTQVIGMLANNFIYFAIWIIFFDKFKDVRGWGVNDMYVTFGVLASAFGIVSLLFGNAFTLSDIISKGRLDYYLSLPRPVLLHTVSSRTIASGLGDFIYGFISYGMSGYFSWDGLVRYVLAMLLAATVFGAFLILTQSLAFWFGTMSNLSGLMLNAMLTFGIYPITLFDSYAKLILFTLIPAALMGAVPAEFIRAFSWQVLGELLLGATGFLALAIFIFHKGLRRYESGSAIQIEI
ncbi:ABC-2 family transporter protein [Candidatus Villigracilis saccharophilus]|uniref:ABC transporter permease n=1 Tax=Candidatus Villigracilis saccharophilus TaxID=3140684 RepID=UPI003136F0E8|nr:ABC-2 family transporter protein [Anaerolineales bacterium]